MKKCLFTTCLALLLALGSSPVFACTNFIVTRGASKDGSVLITYAADSHTRYGAIAFHPSADHMPGSRCEVFHYENGKLLGSIPEVPHTFSVVQFMNEHQVAIGETTFGGLALELHGKDNSEVVDFLSNYSVMTGNKLVAEWKNFYQYLFMKYHDGNLKITEGHKLKDNGNGKNVPVRPLHPGYGKEWERSMIRGTGDRLIVPKK